MSAPVGHVLDRLAALVAARKGADPDSSYTARLYAKGRAKIVQKVGEEAVETVIEGMRGDKERLASESADLLYHLLVLWADCGLDPATVWAELEAREGKTGIREGEAS